MRSCGGFGKSRLSQATQQKLSELAGKHPDKFIAKILGINHTTVARYRAWNKIGKFLPSSIGTDLKAPRFQRGILTDEQLEQALIIIKRMLLIGLKNKTHSYLTAVKEWLWTLIKHQVCWTIAEINRNIRRRQKRERK